MLATLADSGTECLLSAASVWELVIKFSLGKLPLPVHVRDFVPSRLETTMTSVLSVSSAHTLRVADLPAHRRDPFDRVLVAQALVEGVSLLTADQTLRSYDVDIRPT